MAAGYARIVGVIALLVALAVLTGWVFGVPVLTSVVRGWPQMAPLTAFIVALCAIALGLAGADERHAESRAHRRAVLGCSSLALFLALTRLAAYFFGWDLGLDGLGLQGLDVARAMRPGVVSPATALGFALLGGALTLTYQARWARAYQTLALLAVAAAWLGLARYLFGGVPLAPYSQMAIHTGLILLLLATSVLALRRDIGLTVLLTNEGPAGVGARRLLPAALIVPLVAGALALAAEHRGALGVEQSFALFALSSVLVFAGLVWANSEQLRRSDAERQRAEQALSGSEERTRLIVETALDAVITMDRTGTITAWSPQAESLFGWSAGEALGRSLSQTIIPERYRDAHQRGLERYLATGEGPVLNRRIELSAVRRDQSEFPVELAITPMRSGESVTFSAFMRDITQRHRAETALRESQQLMQSILDTSPAVMYVKQLDGRYLLVNRRFEEIFQLSRDAILGRTDYDLFAKEAADKFRSMDTRVAAAGAPLMEEEIVPQIDGPHTYLSVKAPLRDSSGKICGVCGISTDITERKRAEEHLRVQAERLSLLDRSTRAIGERQDLRSIFQVAIRSLEEHLRIDFGCFCLYEPTGRTLEISCVGAKSRELAVELALTEQARIGIDQNGLARCVRGQLVYEADVSGSAFPFPARLARAGLRSLVIAPLSVENRVFGVMIAARRDAGSFASADCEFLRQLSEHLALAAHQAQLYGSLQRAYEDLRQTQESVIQQERLRALGQMASGIAHDINNALSPAALYAQSLLERDHSLSGTAREYLAVIQRAIEDVGQTVARMRMFYRPRETELTLSPVDLSLLVQQVVELTRARWNDMPQERGIVVDLKSDLALDLPPIMGAEHEIRDALTNLIFNAVDAMPEGGTLTLHSSAGPLGAARRDGGSAATVSVEVTDTGIGMTEATRNRCLEPFFTTKGERGTGLGLAMVYGMVKRHGAELEIDSELGAGTTVRLIFPAATPLAEVPPVAIAVHPPQPLRILLVDDDPLLLKSLQDVLESEGHSVTPADGGQRGIDEFFAAEKRREPFAVVITDLGMPNIDGRTVAAALKSAAPTTPVILLTGWGHRLQSEGELPEHVDRVLSKPPRIAALRVALAELAIPQSPQ